MKWSLKTEDSLKMLAIIGVIAWILGAAFMGKPLDHDKVLNNNILILGGIMAIVFSWMAIPVIWSMRKSPTAQWPGGSSYISTNYHVGTIMSPVNSKGDRVLPFDVEVFANGCSVLEGYHTKGGGPHGYKMVANYKNVPGMIQKIGHNYTFNVAYFKAFSTEEEKENSLWFRNRLRATVQSAKRQWDEGALYEIAMIPCPELQKKLKLTDEQIAALTRLEDQMADFSEMLGHKERVIKNLRTSKHQEYRLKDAALGKKLEEKEYKQQEENP